MVDNASFSASSFVDGEISQMPVPGQRHKSGLTLRAQVDFCGGVSGKHTPSRGQGGTDRLGALYEWRVIRPKQRNQGPQADLRDFHPVLGVRPRLLDTWAFR